MASLSGDFNIQEFSDNGDLLVGGRLYTYAQGTTTFKAAYADIAETVPHTYTNDGLGGQYLALNARGELPAPLYLSSGAYDIALKRADGSAVWSRRADGVDKTANSLASSSGASLIGGTWFGGVVALLSQLATSIGASLIGFIAAGAGAVARSIQSKLRDITNANDYSSLTEAFAASNTVFVTTPNYVVSSTLVVPIGKELIILAGGSLLLSGGVTLVLRCKFSAPTAKVFFGAGVVLGIKEVRPEWWGAAGDGSADDIASLDSAHACVVSSGTSSGGRPTILLTGIGYLISRTWNIAPTASINMAVIGNGTIFSGTRIIASASFSSAIVVNIIGQDTSGVEKIADFVFRDIAIVKQSTGGAAIYGLQIGTALSTKALIGLQMSLVENVMIEGFARGIHVVNARLVEFRRCSSWNSSAVGSGYYGLSIEVAGGFTGDLRFENCQFIANTTSGNGCVLITANAAFSSPNNQIAGIKFYGCDFYSADKKVWLWCRGGSHISDIWFNSCQWDGSSNTDLLIDSVNSGSQVDDIRINDCYFAGGNLSVSSPQVVVQSTGTGGTIRNVSFNNSILELAIGKSLQVSNNGVDNVQGISLDFVEIRDNNNTTGPAIDIQAKRFNISNCRADRVTGNFFKYLIQINGISSEFVVTANIGTGIASTATVNDTTGAVSKVVANNL